MKPLLRILCKLLFRVRIEGDLNSFNHARTLVVANHASMIDCLLLGLFLPNRPIVVINVGNLRQRWYRRLLRFVDYLAIDPTHPMALKSIIKLVESGRPVVIFPEGRATTSGHLMKVYDGTAFIAAKTHATIVPVYLSGTHYSRFHHVRGDHPRRWFPQVTLTIHAPTTLDARDGEALRHLMQRTMFASRKPQTLYAAFLEARNLYGKKRRLVEDIKQIEYTYNDILKMTLALGRMVAKESAVGERVGVLLPNLASAVALTLGTIALGRVPVMLNYTAGADGLHNACVTARIKTIFTSREFIQNAKFESLLTKLNDVRIIYLEDLRAQFGLSDKLWVVRHMLFPASAEIKRDIHDEAVILFTSGSEGKPKGVVLSQDAILANIAQCRAVIDFSVEDKVLNALPIFHSFGLTVGAILPLLSGMPVFLYPSPLHYKVIPEIIYNYDCTILFGNSTLFNNYAKHAHPYDFHRLRYVIAGTEKLHESVRATWFEKFGVRILEGYGVTETAPVLSVNTPLAYRSGSVGQLVPGMEYRLVPVAGIARGGELHVRGPNVMSGYLRHEKAGVLEPTASELGAGWYATGDIAEVDDDGYIHIIGRAKRFAKIAGEMISLEAVEHIALAASPAAQHAASSQPDVQRGETIVLFTTDSALTREMLLQAARAQGRPELTVPRKIVVVETLPQLSTGKTDYVTLKQMAELA